MDKYNEDIKNQLKNELAKNKIVHEVALEIGKNTSPKEKLNNILKILEIQYGLKHTLLLFPDNEKTKLTVFASRGFSDSGIGSEIEFGKGIVGMVAKKRKKVNMAGISYYRKYAQTSTGKSASTFSEKEMQLPGLPNVEAQLAFPLIANDELIAVLSIESDIKNFFTREDEEFLHSLSYQMALSIQNALIIDSLAEKVKDRTNEIEKQKTELENLNDTKDKLFSIIGHDLKSPVSSLKLATDLIQYYSSQGDIDKLKEIGYKINTAANNVNQLLDNLLNWAMSQRNLLKCNITKLNVKDTMKRVTDIFTETLHAKDITISSIIEKDCFIHADVDMVMSIFRNVVSNAIKFSPVGSIIQIKAKSANNQVYIEIEDIGEGMSPQKLDALFKLAVKKSTLGTNREKGTGLGMVLVKDFMKLNKGKVSVESTEGKGTKVKLCFPESKHE